MHWGIDGSEGMKVSMQRLVFAVGIICAMFAYSVQAQVNVTTYHNDISRTSQNTQETILAPSNVNSSQFGKFLTVGVDGEVFAQPLYLVNVYIGGGTHNVLYFATEHDSVYAIDADTGTVYSNDVDVASGGLVLLPTLSSGQQLLAQVGKSGTLLFLDRNNLGKYCVNQAPACAANDPQIVQEIPNA